MCQSTPGGDPDSRIPSSIKAESKANYVSEVMVWQPMHRTLWENLGPVPNSGVRTPAEERRQAARKLETTDRCL